MEQPIPISKGELNPQGWEENMRSDIIDFLKKIRIKYGVKGIETIHISMFDGEFHFAQIGVCLEKEKL
jgi:hypothetical protein